MHFNCAKPKQSQAGAVLTDSDRAQAEAFKNEGIDDGIACIPISSHRPLGNDAVKAGNYSLAVEKYSQAIAIDQNNAVYYGNRWVVSSLPLDRLICTIAALRPTASLAITSRAWATVRRPSLSTPRTARHTRVSGSLLVVLGMLMQD